MDFVKGAWKILVGIKDGLVLLFMLLFFVLLFAALSVRPNPAAVKEGALLIDIDGTIVEEPSQLSPFELLSAGNAPLRQYRLRDVVRAIEGAATDDNVKIVVLDLDRFLGAGQVGLSRIAEAIETVKAADKPVYAFATAYGDDAYQLAAHADQVWVDPMGGLVLAGPGGSNLYYKDLLDRFEVTTHIYKVGTYKSAVEPYARSDMSPEAREALSGVLGAMWEQYLDEVSAARPKANVRQLAADPVPFVEAANGDLAKMALDNGFVDKLGDRIAFGKAVSEIAGAKDDGWPGSFEHTRLDDWLAANEPEDDGKRVGVITIAGEIVDGYEGPGIASGDRISDLLYDGLDDDIEALVVRVDSPGGSALASEQIRLAIDEYRKKDIPVVVSMANLAASGGYWVTTSSDHIMAEPATITGSIGVFAVLPSFENAIAAYGVNADGVATTPLSGQPDLLGGFNPSLDAIVQGGVEDVYTRFLGLVSKSRGKTPAQIDEIGQGRIWDGGTARQLGLVDSFGSLDDAVSEAAKRAKLGEDDYYTYFLETPEDPFTAWLNQMAKQSEDEEKSARHDVVARIAWQQQLVAGQVLHDLKALLGVKGVQARCLECMATVPPQRVITADRSVLDWLLALKG